MPQPHPHIADRSHGAHHNATHADGGSQRKGDVHTAAFIAGSQRNNRRLRRHIHTGIKPRRVHPPPAVVMRHRHEPTLCAHNEVTHAHTCLQHGATRGQEIEPGAHQGLRVAGDHALHRVLHGRGRHAQLRLRRDHGITAGHQSREAVDAAIVSGRHCGSRQPRLPPLVGLTQRAHLNPGSRLPPFIGHHAGDCRRPPHANRDLRHRAARLNGKRRHRPGRPRLSVSPVHVSASRGRQLHVARRHIAHHKLAVGPCQQPKLIRPGRHARHHRCCTRAARWCHPHRQQHGHIRHGIARIGIHHLPKNGCARWRWRLLPPRCL